MTKRQPAPPRDDPEQSKRFIEAAIEAGEAEPGEFERAFTKVARRKRSAVTARPSADAEDNGSD